MAETIGGGGVTEDQIKAVAIDVRQHLKGTCKFCPRGFETGEKIVFGTMKTLQMAWIEEDIETATPAGFGEQHIVNIINAHLECAITNAAQFRSVTVPRKLT
ncbi:MAG: hypothetical protein ACXABY_29885 [Candidatus Thorarchaeota archaeon]|jgi:hypothetical protein